MSSFRNPVRLMLAVCPDSAHKEFIYETAPFREAHASTLVQLKAGDLMAAWFGGTQEGAPDVAIWGSTRHNGHWSPPVELARENKITTYNPVLFHTKDGRLWLYFKFGPHPTSWTGARRFSTDEGKTWSHIEHLPAGLYGPIRAKPLVLPDGTVVSGTSVESYRSWACWIDRSTDNGESFTKFGPDLRSRRNFSSRSALALHRHSAPVRLSRTGGGNHTAVDCAAWRAPAADVCTIYPANWQNLCCRLQR